MTAAGLIVNSLEPGRLMRCSVTDSREKRGWYSVHELILDDGDTILVGSFGIWHGNDNGAQKISLQKRVLNADQKTALKAKIAEDRRRANAARAAVAARAAQRANRVWSQCNTTGHSDYLSRKGVGGHGVRYTETGALVVPIANMHGHIHGMQYIFPSGHPRRKKINREKEYWPAGLAKQSNYHLIGGTPENLCLVAEGYATAATLFEATGIPVAIAFDAGNLLPVAQNLHKRYPQAKLIFCADDDYLQKCAACGKMTRVESSLCTHCNEPHKKSNAGIAAASTAAFAVGGSWIAPVFSEDRGVRKLTDFNDLQQIESVAVVRAQIEAHLLDINVRFGGVLSRDAASGGGGVSQSLKPILTDRELHDRFALIYGHNSTVFDFQERMLMTLGDMRDACTHRETHRRWMESPTRKIVRMREVGFDPTGLDCEIKCNLWGGWPTVPRSGCCEKLLELLEYLCVAEENPREIYQWVLKWLAYPIQNPGAKMKTALVLHGPQGVGKNLFFESVMAIYGEYGRIVDQNAVEDKFNDWASKKLFLIADEVVARAELYHTKNKLKSFITSDWIRINPKNVTAYDEKNHVNLTFLSNETHPLVLERDDRRYAVIWTPPKLPQEIYKDVKAEIDSGGIPALHDYLLNLELGEFAPYTMPPLTRSKADLIDLSIDSTERFRVAWMDGEIEGVPRVPCRSQDLYQLYREYCGRLGYPRYAPDPKLTSDLVKRGGCAKLSKVRYQDGVGERQATFIFPPGIEQPEDKTRRIWLGECAQAFKDGCDNWRNDGKVPDF